MKDLILWIETEEKYKNRLFLKCFKNKISILDTKEEGKSLFLKIYEKDYPKIKKFWFVKVKKTTVTGSALLKEKIYRHRIFILSIVFGIIFLFMVSHIIVNVEVIHSNKEIRDLVRLTLKEKGIKENTWKKSYQELERIKKEILKEYPEQLEWMEIETKGMNYIVRIEERKTRTEEEKKTSCHIVATKDAIVKEMVFDKGEAVVKSLDSVKKGDILISGLIKKDDEVKDVVCASGEVYGEVWYQITASIPLEYVKKTRTGKKRWNLRWQNLQFDTFIFRSRLNTYEEEKKEIFKFLDHTFYWVTQYETKEEKGFYSLEEAKKMAVEEAISKLNDTLEEKEHIIMQKVLKNDVNNSTMNVEVFVSVLENIGETQEFQIE